MDLSLLVADVEIFLPFRVPSRVQSPKEINTELIEKMIREKVSEYEGPLEEQSVSMCISNSLMTHDAVIKHSLTS